MEKLPAPVAKTLSKIAVKKTAPVVVDVKTTPLPVKAKAGYLTSKVKPAPQAMPKPLLVRKVAPKPLPKAARAVVLPPRLVEKLAPKLASKPVRRAVSGPASVVKPEKRAPVSATPAVNKTPVALSKSVHEAKSKSTHSTLSRADSMATCKPRPKSNTPSGKAGGSRDFIPWCG